MHFLVLQHLDIEPPALLGDHLLKEGHMLETVHIDHAETIPDTLTGYAGLIVMGGPMSTNDDSPFIKEEIALLQQALAKDFPVLGICLGAQLLARAADAEILPSPQRELGWYPLFPTPDGKTDALFSSLPVDGLKVFQWHGETFSLPDNATHLALCPNVPNQAFRLGSCQYGLQFHVEVDGTIIRQWIDAGESERKHMGENGIKNILHNMPQCLSAMQSFCDTMCGNWLALASLRMEKEMPDGT